MSPKAPTTAQQWGRLVWPLAQQSAAAVVAWLVAARVAGHEEPFFAPVAAVVGLNAAMGQRGSNAVRLLAGVIVGVLVAEAVVWVAGSGAAALAAATLLAALVARAVDDAPIVRAQAAVSAILVTVLGHPEQGWHRLLDAVIGAAVALGFSQLLFTPEPLRLLRRSEATVLSRLAHGLRLTADAVQQLDQQHAEAATVTLRDLRDDLAELRTSRTASVRITRHALTWRRRTEVVVAERERADHLDLLAGSCLMLARTATAVDTAPRAHLATIIRQLATTLEDLAYDPGDRAHRQGAAQRAAELVTWLLDHGGAVAAQSEVAAAYASIRMVAADVMVFAGLEPEQAFSREPPSRRNS